MSEITESEFKILAGSMVPSERIIPLRETVKNAGLTIVPDPKPVDPFPWLPGDFITDILQGKHIEVWCSDKNNTEPRKKFIANSPALALAVRKQILDPSPENYQRVLSCLAACGIELKPTKETEE